MPLGKTSTDCESVTPRVSFLVADRGVARSWFYSAGIELGQWFDGPLSPLPTSSLFNYDPKKFPRACAISRHVVNLPCHSRLSSDDVSHLENTLRNYARANPADKSPPARVFAGLCARVPE